MRRVNRNRQPSRQQEIVAPVGGLNGRDGLSAMPTTDAIYMDNWFPGTDGVESRKGSLNYCTGMPGAVETLATFEGGNSSTLLAFSNGAIYNCNTNVPALIANGRLSNVAITCMFSNAGNQFLIGTSQGDAPISYNGIAITGLAITGVATGQNNLFFVFPFKGRLYFLENNKLGFYYLGVGAIQGGASYFDLSQIAKSGGEIVAIGSYSQDSGVGPEDYIVFVSSLGEYIVYAGFDPANAANFRLVSRYYSAPPIGAKCFFNYNSDLYVITTEGALSMSLIRQNSGATGYIGALTAKLGKFYKDLNIFRNTHGWQALQHSMSSMLIFNAPISTNIQGNYVQYIMNTNTNSWCRFTDWDGICFVLFRQNLYFGTKDGRIVQADVGFSDNGADIKLDCKQAYTYIRDESSGFNKLFHFARVVMSYNGIPPITAALNTDFKEKPPIFITQPTTIFGSLWDVSLWDVANWSQEDTTQIFTVSFGQFGAASSLQLRAKVNGATLKWFTTYFVYEKAEAIF